MYFSIALFVFRDVVELNVVERKIFQRNKGRRFCFVPKQLIGQCVFESIACITKPTGRVWIMMGRMHEQVIGGDIQRIAKRHQCIYTGNRFSTFKVAEELFADSGVFGQFFLGKIPLMTICADMKANDSVIYLTDIGVFLRLICSKS